MGELRFLAAAFLLVLVGVLLWRAWKVFYAGNLAEEGRQLAKSRQPVEDVMKASSRQLRLGAVLLALLGLVAAAAVWLLLTVPPG